MKQGNTLKYKKESIAKMVFRLIKAKKLASMEGKDAAKVLIPAITSYRPQSKFDLTHVYWYLGRFRRQEKKHKSLDHLVTMNQAKK